MQPSLSENLTPERDAELVYHLLNPTTFGWREHLLPMLKTHPSMPEFEVVPPSEWLERLARSDEESVKRSKKAIPLQRWGEVKEIADATVFLFSEAGSYQNGTTMVVDGGQWRRMGAGEGKAWEYPDFLLRGRAIRRLGPLPIGSPAALVTIPERHLGLDILNRP